MFMLLLIAAGKV